MSKCKILLMLVRRFATESASPAAQDENHQHLKVAGIAELNKERRTMKRGIKLLALYACILLTGCASVSGGNVQKMYIRTQMQDGAVVTDAECVLNNDKGSWRVRSPGDTSIVRSNKPMEVKCDKAPLAQGAATVESGTRGAMFGNILFGGVVGAVVDHSSGAAYEYVEIINIIMGKMVAIAAPASAPAPGSKQAKSLATAAAEPAPVLAWTPNKELRAAHPPTQFAKLEDAQAIPSVSSNCRDRYEAWLTHASPKAFAVGPKGNCGYTWGVRAPTAANPDLLKDPAERALVSCTRQGHGACKLYAIDDAVVWAPVSQK